ncbi:hypothetical protein ALP15_200011 [Pseudomonas savastanoi]|uniref:Uncharacterized protein n=1 Tax=Pseudomonas savastanoi TaxID=29438 RepID=A0A3M6ADD3_PSESS|nr:hypothetical protein ALP15_200011 [Pseudomonas savastanoi]
MAMLVGFLMPCGFLFGLSKLRRLERKAERRNDSLLFSVCDGVGCGVLNRGLFRSGHGVTRKSNWPGTCPRSRSIHQSPRNRPSLLSPSFVEQIDHDLGIERSRRRCIGIPQQLRIEVSTGSVGFTQQFCQMERLVVT